MWPLPQGVSFAIWSQMCQTFKMELETCFFFNIPYLTVLNSLEVLKISFNHQNSIK